MDNYKLLTIQDDIVKEHNTQSSPWKIISEKFKREILRDGLNVIIPDKTMEECKGLSSLFNLELNFPIINHDIERGRYIESYCVAKKEPYVYLKQYFQNHFDHDVVYFFEKLLGEDNMERIDTIKSQFIDLGMGLTIKNTDVARYGKYVLDSVDYDYYTISISYDMVYKIIIQQDNLNRLKLDPTFDHYIYQNAIKQEDYIAQELEHYYIENESYYSINKKLQK